MKRLFYISRFGRLWIGLCAALFALIYGVIALQRPITPSIYTCLTYGDRTFDLRTGEEITDRLPRALNATTAMILVSVSRFVPPMATPRPKKFSLRR